MKGTPVLMSAKTIVAASLLAAGTLATAAPAQAATETPQSVCGNGFRVVKDGVRTIKDRQGRQLGKVFLLYNRRTGYNCVVTFRTLFDVAYAKIRMDATLTVQTTTPPLTSSKTTSGVYSRHTKPAKLFARGLCVKYSGTIQSSDSAWVGKGGRDEWGNCGR
ncbi:hypothetical protein OHA25_13140 [Nonomuraea sp. NBC_00507]|uniref:hypothetical protein n=1 Tax=Nonomuraea sp. NBC_00507 TaxID=2976002 RepID=UPI002E19E64A